VASTRSGENKSASRHRSVAGGVVAQVLVERMGGARGQMVFLHEVERRARDVRPTDDVEFVVDLRVEPNGLGRVHMRLTTAHFAPHAASATSSTTKSVRA
jgi:hypothetical protein